MGIARNLASPVGSNLPPGSFSLGFIPSIADAPASATERDDATRSLPASFGSALCDPAPATAAALTLGDALESWSVAFMPPKADPPEPSPTPASASAGADLSPDTAAGLPEGMDAPADASEGLALALWQDGRRDEAIQVLEQGIAMEKHGLPAVLPPKRPANGIAASTTLAVAAPAPLPQGRYGRAAGVGLLAGVALLLAGAALWNGRAVPAGELAEPRPEIAGNAVQAGGETPLSPVTPRLSEPRPAADAPKPSPVASKPPVAETAPLPTSAENFGPAGPVIVQPVPELRRTTPALPVEKAVSQGEVRVPKGRPATPAAETSAVRAPAVPVRSRRAERSAPARAEPTPAAREAEPRRPATGQTPRSRLAQQRAAAERYAARRRAAAERASERSGGPSVLLGGRGLP